MYKFKSKEEQSYSVNILQNGNVIILKLNGIELHTMQNSNKIEANPKEIIINNNKILVSLNYNGDKLLLDAQLNILNEFNSGKDGIICLVNENMFIHIFYSLNYSSSYVGLFDIKSLRNRWRIESGVAKSYFFQKYFIIYESKKASCISIDNGALIWQFSELSNYNWQQKSVYQDESPYEVKAEVIIFLGVYNNLLWLVLNRGSLLALDINTGEVKKHIFQGKSIGTFPKILENAAFSIYSFLDEQEGKIVSLFQEFYLEYDLEKLDDYFEYSSFAESSKKFGLGLNRIGGHDAEYIYAWEDGGNNRFAIFSREKKEIIWCGEIPEVKGLFPALLDVKYGAGKLYVLDKNNTLHIFEKE